MNTMDLDNDLRELRDDYKSGSTQIALKGIDIFKRYVVDAGINNSKEIANKIINTKPTMAALQNLINYSLLQYRDGTFNYIEIKSIPVKCRMICFRKAYEHIIRNKINIIVTCSFSSTFAEMAKYLKQKKLKLSYKVASSPWKGSDYAEITQNILKNTGIDCEIIKSNYFDYKDSIIITGADAFDSIGNAINGTPSAGLAEYAKEEIPYFIIAESFKQTRVLIPENGFDYIDNSLISGYFTDDLFRK